MTQRDLVVLSLASHREWRRPYELERQVVGTEMIGSEADTRLGELFGTLPLEGSTTHTIGKDEYTIETKKKGGERWYRAFLSGKRPVHKFVPVVLPDGRRAVREVIV